MPKRRPDPSNIGVGTNIHSGCMFTGDIEIGKYCAIAKNCVFHSRDHNKHYAALQDQINKKIKNNIPEKTEEKIVIKNNVWIGNNVKVLKGVEIGNGAIIGMGAVVTKDVAPYEIVGGNPAEHIGWRFEKSTRDELNDIEWWNWSESKMKENKLFFETDLKEHEGSIGELIE